VCAGSHRQRDKRPASASRRSRDRACVGNAIFNACGARVRALPITEAAVKAAMKA